MDGHERGNNRGRPGQGRMMPDSHRRGDWTPRKRAHRLNVRVDSDLYRRLRREAADANMSLSAVIRLALLSGVERVTAERIERQAVGGAK